MSDKDKREKELDALQKKVEEQITETDTLIAQAKKQCEDRDQIFSAKGISPDSIDKVVESDFASDQDRKLIEAERKQFLKELADDEKQLEKDLKAGKSTGSKKTKGRIAI